MRRLAVIAAAVALLAQPVMAQDEADELLGTGPQAQQAADSKAADAADPAAMPPPAKGPVVPDANTPGDPAQFAEVARLNGEVLAADAEIAARDRAKREAWEAEVARSEAARAAYEAEQVRYRAEQEAYRAAVARSDAERAAWEERVKACKAGRTAACRAQ